MLPHDSSNQGEPVSRRRFLALAGASAAAAALPTILPSSVFGQNAPSKEITLGIIGLGGMGNGHISNALGRRKEGVRILAVCDVDRFHREKAAARINKAMGNKDCAMFGDFRELNARKDIDAVVVATPDHWHTIPALDAIRNGKDVFVEKPLTLTVQEGQALVAALRKHDRVGQTGTQQRSDKDFRFAAQMIRNGALGKITRIEVLIPANNKYCGATWSPEPVPEGLDYEFWLGPAPWAPFNRQRTHYQFRYNLDYAGGQTTNWGAHYIDIAQWALGMDESGPTEIEGSGEFPTSGLFTAPTRVDFTCRYTDGPSLRVRTRTDGIYDGNVRFHGTSGWLDVSRSKLSASNPDLLKPEAAQGSVELPQSGNHLGNFVECIRSRKRPISDLAIGHRTATVCNIGNIAMQLRRPLKWDPAQEKFSGDEQANRLLGRAMRSPWSLL